MQESALPEAAEILQILQRIELENLLSAHDKLAARQAALPWEKCVAEMWTKDRVSNTTSNASEASMKKSTESLNKVAVQQQPQQQQQQSSTKMEQRPQQHQQQQPQQPPKQLQAQIQAQQNVQQQDVTRVVKIMKQNEPLGATVRNEGERVVIGRVVKGGAAERSAQLFPGDEVLEVNGLKLKGKSVHDICDTLCQMTGTLTFVIIPGPANKAAIPELDGSGNMQPQHHHPQQQQQHHPMEVQQHHLMQHQPVLQHHSVDEEVVSLINFSIQKRRV